MSSPTEQLVRDYLSRLSAAARGQLDPGDRRALVDRTREFIEREAELADRPTPLEVGRLLSGLGDPAGIVSQERDRLTTLRGEPPEPVSRGRLARALRGEPGKLRGASRHWPVQPGSRADLQVTLIDGDAPAGGPEATARAAAGSEAARPVPAEVPASARRLWPALAAGTAEAKAAPAGAADRDTVERDTAERGLAGMNWQLVTAELRRPSRSWQLLATAGSWSRHHKLEAVAIALLGLGGAILPPVWLLGAAVALASRLWDYRDKWVGLALPVLVTVVGTAAGISVGGQVSFGHSLHEGWVFAVDVSRATAVLSACYLGWRAARGPRPPAVPPWDKPHRVT